MSKKKYENNSARAYRCASSAIFSIFLWLYAIISLYPLIWMIFYSFEGNDEIFVTNPFGLPGEWKFSNYVNAWTQYDIPLYFKKFPYAAINLAFACMVYYGFFRGIPKEVEKAPSIDGAKIWRTFISIIEPLVVPATITIGIYVFLAAWNGFILINVLVGSFAKLKTLPLGVLFFQGQFTTDWRQHESDNGHCKPLRHSGIHPV